MLKNDFSLQANKAVTDWLSGHAKEAETYLNKLKKDFTKEKVAKLVQGLTDDEKKALLK